jgi:glutathione synthase/RimK-type ligase-like ATP-grasp enzyme
MHAENTNSGKKILVLFPFKKDKRLDFAGFVRAINSEAGKELAVQGSLKNLIFEIRDSKLKITESLSSKDLNDFKAIYIRRLKSKTQEKVTAVSIAAKAWGLNVINSENSNLQSFSKLTELVALSLNNLPIPDTIIAAKPEVKVMLKNEEWWLTFPLIMKDANGSIGSRNYLIKNKKELKQVLNLSAKARLVLEEELSKEIKNDAINAAKALDRELCGVDILIDKQTGRHYILEVNKKTMLDEGTFIPQKMKAVSDFFKEL